MLTSGTAETDSFLNFVLNPALDIRDLASRFAADRHVRVIDVVAPSAAVVLQAELEARSDWRQMINAGDKVYELDWKVRAGMDQERLRALDAAVYSGARDGFQFRYEAIRVPDDDDARKALASPLAQFARWLSSDVGLQLVRSITEKSDIRFADAQATAFSSGDFLTGHDDRVAGKQRAAAYVFGLTPVWRLEWGGLLLFHPGDARTVQGRVPSFNTLDIFDVPIVHSVSLVTPFAPVRRLSVTGWLRSSG